MLRRMERYESWIMLASRVLALSEDIFMGVCPVKSEEYHGMNPSLDLRKIF